MNNLTWLGLLGFHLLAVMSPGPDFAVVFKNALTESRKAGIFATLGIVTSNFLHIVLTLLGVNWLFHRFPRAQIYFLLVGGLYFIYLAIKVTRGIISETRESPAAEEDDLPPAIKAMHSAYLEGIFTSIFNVKALLYFSAVLSGVSALGISHLQLTLLIGGMLAASFAWFSLLAILCSSPAVQKQIRPFLHWVSVGCAAIFALLGALFLFRFFNSF